MQMTLREAATVVGGELHGDDRAFVGLATDSRGVRPNELFVTLHGPSFDGHDFLDDVRALGAPGALLERLPSPLPAIVVDDARAAMGRLSASWRARFDVTTVGITGSNGKTTVKEMVAAILAQDAPVLATRGNLNNDIGVPLTLACLAPEHRRLVVEMGANHPGEIAALAALARPQVGVITLIAPAHLEGFGSVEGVARAKGELLAALPAHGVAVVNADDAHLALWRELAPGRRMITFGTSATADVSAAYEPAGDGSRVTLRTPRGEISVNSKLCGRHNAINAAAATAAALALDIDADAIKAGLETVRPVAGRLQVRREPGRCVLDDTYNANPDSLRAALDVLSSYPAPRWLVLGDMGELGAGGAGFHHDAGRLARERGVDRLYATGALSARAVEAFGEGAAHYADRTALTSALNHALDDALRGGPEVPVHVLVKGSRAMAMESVVHSLLEGDASCC